jgi:beta-glucanase (GH16 family)
MGGGGNWEFEWYVNNRTNSFVKDGVLHLQPTLTADAIGEEAMKTGDINIWGNSPADMCTGNAFYGCERNAAGSGNYNNPIRSARVRSVNSFAFTYGKLQIRAKMPTGDWLWPAIWLLPKNNEFGNWPASGEIDLVESRGNANCDGGVNSFASTLHFGPGWPYDAWDKAHAEYTHPSSLGDDFHVYELEWTKDHIITRIDDTEVLNFPFDQDLFTKGGFDPNLDNPWQYETDLSAPFNREFYLIFNVAVGGTNDYFPDGWCAKPWNNVDPKAVNTFYDNKEQWFPSWNYPATHDSAMQIDWVKVYSLDGEETQLIQ